MNFEIPFGGKSCDFLSLQHLLSQSSNVNKTLTDNLELNLDKIANKNPYLLVAFGNFSIKSSNYYKQDKTTYKSSQVNAIISQFRWK